MGSLVQSTALESPAIGLEPKLLISEMTELDIGRASDSHDRELSEAETSETAASGEGPEAGEKKKTKKPRKLVAEEQRNMGSIQKQVGAIDITSFTAFHIMMCFQIWGTYLSNSGGYVYWALFTVVLLMGAISPILENGWLKYDHFSPS